MPRVLDEGNITPEVAGRAEILFWELVLKEDKLGGHPALNHPLFLETVVVPATGMALFRANGPFPYQPGPTGRVTDAADGLRAVSPPHRAASREVSAVWAGLSALENQVGA